MLFEPRTTVPEVSPVWEPVRDLFLGGRTREACALAVEIGKAGASLLRTANDCLLQLELARASGEHKRALAWARFARRRHPDDLLTILFYSRSLLSRHMHGRGIAYLESFADTWARSRRVAWTCMLADLHGDAGFQGSALRLLAAMEDEPEANEDPLALYHRSCAFEGLRRWPEAIALAERCIEKAPGWLRARGYLVHCLLTQGRAEEARKHLEIGLASGLEDSSFDTTAAMFTFSEGRYDLAERMLRSILERWPESDHLTWARRTLCLLLVESGRYREARELQVASGSDLAFPPIPESVETTRHCFIPLPFIAQNRNQCVPTCVAMAAHPQGDRFDPEQLFHEMEGRDGTALWRMREWVEAHGYELVPVRLEAATLRRVLDTTGIPLIGVLEGAFNSHVEVVCGFHEALDVFYVRDPSHWAPVACPAESVLVRYELHGALYAVAKRDNPAALATLREARSDEGEALIDLAAAVSKGNRAAAEAAAARVPGSRATALIRDLTGLRVTLSPKEFRRRMESLGRDPEINGLARFRALMMLGWHADTLDVLDEVVREQKSTIGRRGLLILALLRARTTGQWELALRLVDRLLLFASSVESFWDHRADILTELGDPAGSRQALEKAIDLAPHTVSYREKLLQRTSDHYTWREYFDHFARLQAEDPHDRRLLWGLAQALQDGPEGLRYEAAARELVQWFPREPDSYLALSNWFGHQGREDLSEAVLAPGRLLLEGELPAALGEPGKAAPPGHDGVDPGTEPEAAPPAKEEWMRRLWVEPAQRGPALAALLETEEAGSLEWQERAQLLAWRLLHEARPGEAISASRAVEILPESLPGAPHWFLTTLSSAVTGQSVVLQPPVAAAILGWMDRVYPGYRGHVGLWFNRVLLHEAAGRMEEALRDLQALLERYPAHSSALYRMGVVKYRQQDLPAAATFFRRALEVNPGLPGALRLLRDVANTLDDEPTYHECLERLVVKFPYDFEHLRTRAVARQQKEGLAAALATVEEAAGRFPPALLDTLRARCHLVAESHDEARAILAPIDPRAGDELLREQTLQLRMRLAQIAKDREEILRVCALGLEFWPTSTRLKEIRAENSEPADARVLLENVLLEGEPSARTAWQFLSLHPEAPDQAARVLIRKAASSRVGSLLDHFGSALSQPELLPRLDSFLTWAWGAYPWHNETAVRLAMHCNINQQSARAVALARELLEREPTNPIHEHLLGRCLIDTDPQAALIHLRHVCERNRSASYLFDLARCEQILKNHDAARAIHREVLEKNPHDSASVTNLYLLGEPSQFLWPLVNPILEDEIGETDEYFLVVAVHLALAQRETVDPAWLGVAALRLSVLRTHPGFKDEALRLRRAITAWIVKRPEDVAVLAREVRPSRWQSLLARFRWPGTKWVPASGD